MIQGIGSASSSVAGVSSSAVGTQSSSQVISAAQVRKQVNALSQQFPKLSVSISPAFIDKMAKEILLPQGAELAKRPRRLNSQDAQNMEEAMPFSDMASG